MSEVPPRSHELAPLSLGDVQAMTAQTAGYQDTPDPNFILRRGLVEEVYEYIWERTLCGTPDKDQLEGEVGDMVWYVSEISRSQSIAASTITGPFSLDQYQSTAEEPLLHIENAAGESLKLSSNPDAVLAITALRVADVMNPTTDSLWIGQERCDLAIALTDFLIAVSRVARSSDIRLSDAIEHTIDKLNNRERRPHVLDEAQEKQRVTTGRGRLLIDPFVINLLGETIHPPEFLEINAANPLRP